MTSCDPVQRAAELERSRRFGVRQHAPRPVVLTCWSCSHLTRVGENYLGVPRLWCERHDRRAASRCADFDYCPGSDEAERAA